MDRCHPAERRIVADSGLVGSCQCILLAWSHIRLIHIRLDGSPQGSLHVCHCPGSSRIHHERMLRVSQEARQYCRLCRCVWRLSYARRDGPRGQYRTRRIEDMCHWDSGSVRCSLLDFRFYKLLTIFVFQDTMLLRQLWARSEHSSGTTSL